MFFKSRAFIAICILAVLLLGMSLLSMTERGKVTIFEDIIGIIVTPLQRASSRLVGAGGDFAKVFTEYDALQAQNEQLQKDLEKAQAQLRDAQQAMVENENLREILSLAEQNENYRFSMAHVIAKEQTGFSATITLDRGSAQGLQMQDMVVTGAGVVGYVSELGTTWAKVTTLLDSTCEIGVIASRTQDIGVLEGDFTLAENYLCRLSYLKNEAALTIGDSLETSGIGGIFPKGLFVGRVKEIKVEAHGLSQYAIIEPSVDFTDLDTVFVITEFNEE